MHTKANNANVVIGLLVAAYIITASEKKTVPIWALKLIKKMESSKISAESPGTNDPIPNEEIDPDQEAEVWEKYERTIRWFHSGLQIIIIVTCQG